MSVIIRLQNLPWSANALDIRQFFRGLSIPEGGVHIVGGELGDAFIAFSTDEDARQAFQMNNGKIKEVQIKLLLSSRTEMQKVIEAARNMQTPFATAVVQPAVIPPVAAVHPIQDVKRDDSRDSVTKDDSRSGKSRDRRRSRSRTRSRDRKDRSRDRRDRRRRDRSRSRDRRDRRRDRKDRSKSRERTRSRDRDSRRSRDKKRDPRNDDKNDVIAISNSPNINTDLNNLPKLQPNPWERVNTPRLPLPVNNSKPNQPSLLGNYPGPANTSLEDARRSLGLVTGLQNLGGQNNMLNMNNDMGNNFPRNDMLKRDTWQLGNKSRFPDRNPIMDKPNIGNHYPPNPSRPPLGQSDMNFGLNQRMPNMFQSNMSLRMPFNQDLGSNLGNRPFPNRPGALMPNRNMQSDFHFNSNKLDIKEDNVFRKEDNVFRKDNRNRVEGPRVESCVQLRPYYGGYGDLRRFFHGLHISNSGIKFAVDNNGKPNGTIYVKFVRSDARPQALAKNGEQLRGIVVEVLALSNEEFDKCGKEQLEIDEDKDSNSERDSKLFVNKVPFTCLVVDDIPTYTKEHDILKMFSDYSLLGIHIQCKNRRRMAYVQFNKEDDAAQALGEKNKHFLGGKPITVRPCTDKQFSEARIEQEEIESPAPKHEPPEIKEETNDVVNTPDQFTQNAASFDTDVILLTGMPYKTTDRDVIDFFSDIGLVPTRIHMLINKFGPSGECYCEFSNPDEAIAALDKNGMPLGTGVVNVEPFPRREMERNLGLSTAGPPMSQLPNNRFLGRLGPRPGMMGMNPRPLLGNNMIRHPNPMSRFDGPHEGNNMGMPGCVLSMENVPFKAGVDEILDFFENFDVSNHNVLRRYNDNGTPTGDARVTFSSPSEAHRAFEECRFKKIRDRTIYLRIL